MDSNEREYIILTVGNRVEQVGFDKSLSSVSEVDSGVCDVFVVVGIGVQGSESDGGKPRVYIFEPVVMVGL